MQDLSGQFIDQYHILQLLEQGDKITVYKAYDSHLDREVAIKIIHRDGSTLATLKSILKRFGDEAKTLASLPHPNILTIQDYGEFQGSLYLVMQLVKGESLTQYLGNPLPYTDAARLLLPIAKALQFTHEHHILHRDVNPANILMTESGEALLFDFGLFRILESEGETNQIGVSIGQGTPGFMSPEQGLGKIVDERADIYSLGVVLYELVTGNKPFYGATPNEIISKHINNPLPRPKLFIHDIPEFAELAIIKALAKNPDNRYASLAEFAEALEKMATGQIPDKMQKVEPRKSGLPSISNLPQQTQNVELIIDEYGSTSSKKGDDSISETKKTRPKEPFWLWGILGITIIGVLAVVITSITRPIRPTPIPLALNQATNTQTLVIPSESLTKKPTLSPTSTEIPTDIPTPTETVIPTPVITFSQNLTIWVDSAHAPVLQDFANSFKQKYGVDLIVESKSSVRDEFQKVGLTGKGPDIILISHDQAWTLIGNDLLTPVDLGGKDDLFVPVAVGACTFKRVLYCIPIATENLGFFYNTDLVATPPTTWEEVVSIGENLKNQGKVTYVMGITGVTYDLYPVFTSFGGYIFAKYDNGDWNPNDLGIDSPGMIAAATWLQQNVVKGNLPRNTDWAYNHALFENGEVPFLIAGPWALQRIRQSGVDYAITNFPSGGRSYGGTQGFFVNANSENQLLAQTFLREFVATDEVMQLLADAGQRPSAFLSVLDNTSDPDLKAFGLVGSNAEMMPTIPAMGSVWGSWSDAIKGIIAGTQDPETALKDAATKIRSLISGN